MKQESKPEAPNAPELYVMSGMPHLLSPAGQFQRDPNRYEPSYGPFESPRRRDSPQVRRSQRAPKLGQIGRSKKVDIEDEDLDDMLNNNSPFPVPVNLLPVA